MKKIKKAFKKPCSKCGNIFEPRTRATRICKECSIKTINCEHLRRIKFSLEGFVRRNFERKSEREVKFILNFMKKLDYELKKCNQYK